MKKFYIMNFIFFALWSSNVLALSSGQPATNPALDGVVQLLIPGRDLKTGEVADAFCNATFISQRQLLTAAHCFSGHSLGAGELLKIQFGRYEYRDINGVRKLFGYKTYQSGQYRVKVYARNLQLQKQTVFNPADDFILIEILDGEIPAVPLIPIWNGSIDSKMELYVASINPISTISHMNTFLYVNVKNISQNSQYFTDSQNEAKVEPGDSGAPLLLFYNNQFYLIGVTKGEVRNFMNVRNIYTSVVNRSLK